MRIVRIAAIAVLSLSVMPAKDGKNGLVVHEWGTFTSVADERGLPVQWAPLSGAEDLPCFVSRLDLKNYKAFPGMVRMETPVLFFYSQRPVTASVHVDFPKGWITEYYPQPSSVSKEYGDDSYTGLGYRNGRADWNSIEVLPGENPPLPSSKGASRYYEARNTDAAAIRVGQQNERMIFYRGIGGFTPPLQPKLIADGKLQLRTTTPDAIPLAIVFENRGGKIGYRFVRGLSDPVTVDLPEMTGDQAQLRKELAAELIEFGLYEKEARAMVETWHDSWLEDGMRVFYVVPRPQTDSLLPLKIAPVPDAVARVFVGRVEVLSPWTRQTIEKAADNRDFEALKKFGRFLEPFAEQMHDRSSFMRDAEAKIAQTASGAACIR
jgi:hypothetical protein